MFVEMPGIVQPEEWPISNATWPGWTVTQPTGNADHPKLRMEFCVHAVIEIRSV